METPRIGFNLPTFGPHAGPAGWPPSTCSPAGGWIGIGQGGGGGPATSFRLAEDVGLAPDRQVAHIEAVAARLGG